METFNQALRFVPQSRNIMLSALTLGLQAAGLLLTPLTWAWSGWAFAGWLLVYGYATILCWLMIHEAVHYKLLHDRRANIALGRALAITFGCPFHILKIGHMSHHRYNRGSLDSNELVPANAQPFALYWLAYYGRILGALYLAEVIVPLVFFFWKRFMRLADRWSQGGALSATIRLFTRRLVHTVQFDAVLCTALFAAQIWCNHADIVPFIILFGWRAFIVSFYDNAYHYGNDPSDVHAANNLSVPGFLQHAILNHNLHRLHHRYPTASWALLPDFARRDAEGFDAPLVTTIWRQIKGPVRRTTQDSTSHSHVKNQRSDFAAADSPVASHPHDSARIVANPTANSAADSPPT